MQGREVSGDQETQGMVYSQQLPQLDEQAIARHLRGHSQRGDETMSEAEWDFREEGNRLPPDIERLLTLARVLTEEEKADEMIVEIERKTALGEMK